VTELALVVAPAGGPAHDVVVAVDDHWTMTDLGHALRAQVEGLASRGIREEARWYHARLGRWVRADESIAALELRCGDELLFAPRRTPSEAARARRHGRLELAVVAGPDAGSGFALCEGGQHLGRESAADVTVRDASVSRRHLSLRVDGDRVTIEDAGSTSGTAVEGERVTGPRVIEAGEHVTVGDTTFAIRPALEVPRAATVDRRGRIAFNRPPRVVDQQPVRRVLVAAPPDVARRSRLSGATAVAPLLMGAAFFALTRSPLMLVFMALSPVIAVWSFLEERRRARTGYRRAADEFRGRVRAAKREVIAARRDERDERRQRCPDPAATIAVGLRRGVRLWERRPTDDDFLRLRLGSAPLASNVEVVIEPGGSANLRAEAELVLGNATRPFLVPATIDLGRVGACGLAGPPGTVHSLAGWMAVQVAVWHSPREVVVTAGIGAGSLERWDWSKWLPHVELPGAAGGGAALALGSSAAKELVDRLEVLVASRASRSRSLGAQDDVGPRVVAFLDGTTHPDAATVDRLLAAGPEVGVFVVWLGEDPRDLPGECGVTVEVTEDRMAVLHTHRLSAHGMNGSPNPSGRAPVGAGLEIPAVEIPVVEIPVVDGLGADHARRVALTLAGVRDAGAARATGSLPRTVALLDLVDLLGRSELEPGLFSAVWDRSRGLRAVLGVGTEGPFELDLVHDGPHTLIAGTTGSGKSELLQALVASLASCHPPERCTFLLIDYKGGSAFRECVRLPHTVGFVTDLDDHLAHRVLTSLRAEVRYREQTLRHREVKDLDDLESRDPGAAPPRLVIVIDEFATLAREVPEFVDGIVDVAQRGRSLGLHLVLATQRPNGVVSENIRANTNLRIALRVHDVGDSRDVVQSDDAARIPRFLPGRAVVRTGHAELVSIQCAYAGGVSEAGSGHAGSCTELVFGGWVDEPLPDPASKGSTDLSRLVDAIVAADAARDRPPLRRPWLAPLADRIPLAACRGDVSGGDVPADDVSGDDPARRVAIGMIDDPARQRQDAWAIDLERAGSVLVFGTTGAGKTPALCTIASALAGSASPRDVQLYAIDGANRGLGILAALPHCGEVVALDDMPRVVRLLEMLEGEVGNRTRVLAEAGVSSLGEYRARRVASLPRIVVLLDGYASFAAAFERVDFGDWVECLHRLVGRGRALGMHFVITADRRGSVSAPLLGAISTRIVLRAADGDELVALGVPANVARGAKLGAGRGFVDGFEIQLAGVGDAATGPGPALAELGRRAAARWPGAVVPTVPALPASVSRVALPAARSGLRPLVGIGDDGAGPVAADLDRGAFLIAGPPRSGRSAALRTIVASAASAGDVDVRLFTPREPFDAEEIPGVTITSSPGSCEAALVALAAGLGADPLERPVVVAIDEPKIP